MEKTSGIYIIGSKTHPDRCYVGSTKNLQQRLIKHRNQLKYGKHHSPILQDHYNKYGLNDLTFSVLMYCDKECLIPINKVVLIEQIYILLYAHEKHNMSKPYFNSQPTAGSSLGCKQSDATKEKHRKNMIGNKYAVGTVSSEETKERIRQAQFIINQDPEVRKNKSEKLKGLPAWNKGLKTGKRPKEVCDKISKGNKGKPKSPEHAEKCREGLRKIEERRLLRKLQQ
jgi:group I intron endonuclease